MELFSLIGLNRYPSISLDARPAVVSHACGRSGFKWIGHHLDALQRVQTHVRNDDVTGLRNDCQAKRVPKSLGLELQGHHIRRHGCTEACMRLASSIVAKDIRA